MLGALRCPGAGRGGRAGPGSAAGASAAPSAGLLRGRSKGLGCCAGLGLPVTALSSSAADTAAGVLGMAGSRLRP